MGKKERLDKILTDRGFFETKSKAQAAIMAADVKVNGETVHKAGEMYNPEANLDIEIKSMPYVSRGAYKIEKAIKVFNLNLKDRVCLDAGASTGGFTDCMLQNGAKKVYAADVGYGQLAWKIRNDERVKTIERVNLKNCLPSEIYDNEDILPDFCAMDLSFISILKVLPNIKLLLKSDTPFQVMSLIKPQFEAGKEQVGKNGVVRDKDVHIELIRNIAGSAAELGFFPQALDFSPIKGPAGNIEYLILFENSESSDVIDVESVVDRAFATLNT